MGSPVAPQLADLVLEILQDEIIRKLKFRLPFFFRFVDDIYTAVPTEKKEEMLKAFNTYNNRIQFTKEEETDQKLAFLDTLCIRDGQRIKTNWYHKSTWSGRYLNYKSHLPIIYKRNTISILTNKILDLADPEFHKENFTLLRNTLTNNGYPRKLVNDIIQTTINKYGSKNPSTDLHKEAKDNTNMVAIPYASGLFEDIKKEFQQHDIKVVAKPTNNLKMSIFSNIKDKTPLLKQSNVVYEIPCECTIPYRGKTKQRLEKRIGQHKYNISTKNELHSGLCEHSIKTGHKPRWSGVRIIYKENNPKRLGILESIAIKKTTTNLNKQLDSQYLPVAYHNIL